MDEDKIMKTKQAKMKHYRKMMHNIPKRKSAKIKKIRIKKTDIQPLVPIKEIIDYAGG